jgi:hypothetical protein
MLALDDPKWKDLDGGHRKPYDASVALRRLEAGETVWPELWSQLHHEGDVGVASYAAIPQLVRMCERQHPVDYNLYALASTIEIERHRKTNPTIPDWLAFSYRAAWKQLATLALADLANIGGALNLGATQDSLAVRTALSVVALAHAERRLGAVLNYMGVDEVREYLETHLGWSELYHA